MGMRGRRADGRRCICSELIYNLPVQKNHRIRGYFRTSSKKMRLLGFLHEEDGVHSSVWYTVLLDSTCLELRRFQNLCSDDCRNDETAQLAYWKDLYSGAVLSCCTMFFK
jgi:hypothetical protein